MFTVPGRWPPRAASRRGAGGATGYPSRGPRIPSARPDGLAPREPWIADAFRSA